MEAQPGNSPMQMICVFNNTPFVGPKKNLKRTSIIVFVIFSFNYFNFSQSQKSRKIENMHMILKLLTQKFFSGAFNSLAVILLSAVVLSSFFLSVYSKSVFLSRTSPYILFSPKLF